MTALPTTFSGPRVSGPGVGRWFWSGGFAAAALIPIAFVAIPLVTLITTVVTSPTDALVGALFRIDLPGLLGQAVAIALGATVWAVGLGAPLAWFVARTDTPGRRVFRLLTPLTLAIPPYVLALAYAVILAPGGLLHRAVADVWGVPIARVALPPLIYAPSGAAFILGLAGTPTVFLLVHGALVRVNPALEEAARGLGLGPFQTMRRVTLPLLRAPLIAGALLVFLYGCVDFGVVSLLRARTVTTALYTYLLTGFAPGATAALALGLVALLWLVLYVQRRMQGVGAGGAQHRDGHTTGAALLADARGRLGAPPLRLGRWRWISFAYGLAVLALTAFVPLGVLLWLALALGLDGLGSFWLNQMTHLGHTVTIGLVGATLATTLGVGVALTANRTPIGGLAVASLQAGYAVPGTILALALVAVVPRIAPWLDGTAGAIVIATVILVALPAYQSVATAFATVPPGLVAAARGLGASPVRAVGRVVVPIALPGLIAGWAMAFALISRELAATLLLRPPGYDTLAVRVWVHTTDVGPDPRGAAVALVLVLLLGVVWTLASMVGSRTTFGVSIRP